MMPIHPFIPSAIHPDDIKDQDYFEQRKRFNILLSVASR